MVLNLLAILIFLGAVFVVIVLLWRLTGARGGGAGEPVCLACGAPASQLVPDSFICPACERDVRQSGLAAKPPRVLAQPFWWFVAFTAIVCILGFYATQELRSYFHQVNTVANDEEFWGDGKHNYRVNLDANLTRAGDHGPFRGELDGDLLSAGGNLLTLQIHCPSLRYEVTDDTGRTILPMSQGAFDESAIVRWLAAADLDPHDASVRGLARRTYQSICSRLDVQPGPLPPLQSPSMSGGSSGSYVKLDSAPPALMPANAIVWSIVWLVGTWLILRVTKRKAVVRTVMKEAAV